MYEEDPRYPEWLTGMFLNCIKNVRKICKAHGWAIGVHGSLSRDLDLIAVPWTEKAAPEEVIIEAIRQVVNGLVTIKTESPHGRISVVIMMTRGAYIDLAVFPRQSNDQECSQ